VAGLLKYIESGAPGLILAREKAEEGARAMGKAVDGTGR